MKPYGYVEYEYECLCGATLMGHRQMCRIYNERRKLELVESARKTGIARHFQEQEQMTGIERHFEETE